MASAARPLLALGIAVVGTLLVTLYAVWAYVHIMVLNPLAAVPGLALEEIWREVEQSQGSIHRITVPAFLAVGPLLALVFLVCSQVWLRQRPALVAIAYLGLLVFGAPGEFVASFMSGMNLADAFLISGADYSPWAAPLMIISAVAFVALIAAIVAVGLRAAHATASPLVPAR
ncbi:hypothetical protein [Microbacterium invictum]|uniref:Uncharacterized protein n=1 Tax=Microbacterium invictum TaxID=515415 RepID=A0ABZ0VCY0_9MICO|nr:hypothetical protein [Microbacterium invictum]WQB69667.1 hypothetical protein T9R20_13315 [Microbacterium invictum]